MLCQRGLRRAGVREYRHDCIAVKDATRVTIYGAFATNYNVHTFDIDESIDYRAVLRSILDKLDGVTYGEVKAAHLRDHAAWFSPVALELDGSDYSDEPTDLRLKNHREGRSDPDLYALYYQFGRYLLSECSGKRATLPANLQGIWCHDFCPPWGSDYHTNINLQMNYWPAETGNLSRTVEPLVHFIRMLSVFGEQTAREQFGARGWTVNHTTDVFGRTGVHDSVDCGFFPMAGPWLCLSLWEHYEFSKNRDYLREIYPILRGSCLFVLDYMVEAPDGTLMTAPSNSPENCFYYDHPDGGRKRSMFTRGATIDYQIIYALFTRTIHASEALGEASSFANDLRKALDRLPPMRVSERYGTIREWILDYEEAEPGHRHISHLFGLHPADQINESDPVIYEAAKKTIARRIAHGGGATGWSRAWIVNFYARLKDGEQALSNLRSLLSDCTAENMFDIHPPFQIDGNFGGSAAIAEMLLQSHLGEPDSRVVELLPALPAEWRGGTVRGLKARGDLTFDICWKDGKLTEVRVKAASDTLLRLKLPARQPSPEADIPVTVDGDLLKANLIAGRAVTLTFD